MNKNPEAARAVIDRHEAELARIIAGRTEMLLAIDARLRAAEQVITDATERPGLDKIDSALAAHSETHYLAKLRESIAEPFPSNPAKLIRSRDAWYTLNQFDLTAALQKVLDGKAAGRDAYLKHSAALQGRLSEAAVLAQGEPNESAADEALTQAEGDLYQREEALALAKKQLRALETDVTYAGWDRARSAVQGVDFTFKPEANEAEER